METLRSKPSRQLPFPVHRNASPPFIRSHSFATRRHRHRRRLLACLRRRSHAPGRRLHQGVSPGGAGRRTAGSARHTTHLPGGKTTCARRATRRKRHAHERRRSYTPPKADKGCSYTLALEPTPTGLDPKEDTWLIVGRIASEGGETRQGKARQGEGPIPVGSDSHRGRRAHGLRWLEIGPKTCVRSFLRDSRASGGF